MLNKLKELINRAESIGDSQEFGLNYGQLSDFFDGIVAIVTEAEQNKPSPEETKEKLSDLLAMCVIEQTICNSDGKPVSNFRVNLFDEPDMYDAVAGYLVENGVGFVTDEKGESGEG